MAALDRFHCISQLTLYLCFKCFIESLLVSMISRSPSCLLVNLTLSSATINTGGISPFKTWVALTERS